MTKIIVRLLLGLFTIFLMLGCEDTKYPEDIWNSDEEPLPNPEVAFVVPSDSAYAGVGEIKIYGKNFNPDPVRNYVHFGSESADVLNVSDTLIYYSDTVSISYDTVSTEPLEIDTIYTTEILEEDSLIVDDLLYGKASSYQISIDGTYIITVDTSGVAIFSDTLVFDNNKRYTMAVFNTVEMFEDD